MPKTSIGKVYTMQSLLKRRDSYSILIELHRVIILMMTEKNRELFDTDLIAQGNNANDD